MPYLLNKNFPNSSSDLFWLLLKKSAHSSWNVLKFSLSNINKLLYTSICVFVSISLIIVEFRLYVQVCQTLTVLVVSMCLISFLDSCVLCFRIVPGYTLLNFCLLLFCSLIPNNKPSLIHAGSLTARTVQYLYLFSLFSSVQK